MTLLKTRPRRVLKAADGSVVPSTYLTPQQQQLELQRQQMLAQSGAGGAASQQATSAIAGVASGLGPQGAAVAAGLTAAAGVQNMINSATTDKNGFAETGNGATFARGLGQQLNPLSIVGTVTDGFKNLNNSHMSTAEKVGAFLPGVNAWAMRKSVERAREKYLQKKNDIDINTAVTQNQQANYQGLAYAESGGVVPLFAVGGGVEPPPKKTAPTASPAAASYYSIKNPSPQAQQYYQNFNSTAERLIGAKHDEVYTDPETGKQCTANSCLSFATTLQEQATGTTQPRAKQNLYNPEFARTAEQQGWIQVPFEQAQAGDRLQRWAPLDQVDNGAARQADLGDRQLVKNAYPDHMMILGAPMQQIGTSGHYQAKFYQDGHQFAAADKGHNNNVTVQNHVVYRYIGTGGQPTDNAAEAVAVNPAAQQQLASTPVPALRTRPGQVARHAAGGRLAGPGKPKPGAAPLTGRFADPRREAAYHAWVTKLPEGHRQSIDPTTGNGRDYDYRRAFEQGIGTGANGHFTDTYKLPTHRTFSTESMYFNEQNRDQAGSWQPVRGGGNRWTPLNADVKLPFAEDAQGREVPSPPMPVAPLAPRPAAPAFREGGALPASVIASGALHSEKHALPTASGEDLGTKGIPIVAFDGGLVGGVRVAELERDELTMPHELSKQVEKLAKNKEHDVLGKLVAEQLRTNTVPSNRYRRRLTLAEGGRLAAETFTQGSHALVMLGPDGNPQMALKGGERIFSREHTREMVTSGLAAKTAGQYKSLGRRVAAMIAGQDKRLAKA